MPIEAYYRTGYDGIVPFQTTVWRSINTVCITHVGKNGRTSVSTNQCWSYLTAEQKAAVVFSADVSFMEDDIPVMESKILTVLDTLTSRLL